MNYLGYTICVAPAKVEGGFTVNIERLDGQGNPENLTIGGSSEHAALDSAKRLVRMAVNNKLPLGLAARVSGL